MLEAYRSHFLISFILVFILGAWTTTMLTWKNIIRCTIKAHIRL